MAAKRNRSEVPRPALKTMASLRVVTTGPTVECMRCDRPDVPVSEATPFHKLYVCLQCKTDLSKLKELKGPKKD